MELGIALELAHCTDRDRYRELHSRAVGFRAHIRKALYGYLSPSRTQHQDMFRCTCQGGIPHAIVIDGNSIGYHAKEACIERPWEHGSVTKYRSTLSARNLIPEG